MISIAHPEIGDEEIKAVNEVLESGMLAQGPKVAEFEKSFAEFCGTKYALAVNSGTAAIHAALYAAGVGPGDEVITVPFSFIASINPILMLGATPVLVDIDPVTFCMDPSKLEAAITSKTKAIIPVHLYGQVADMDEINAIAKKHGLFVIEDACQAVNAEYNGKKAGNLGDLGCFSLYATKNIMSGEGGIITTNDDKFAERIRMFRQHGMSAQYTYEDIGFNYRLTDLLGAIALEQLKKVDRFTVARQENARKLDELLADVPGVVLPETKADRNHVYHQYTIRITPEFALSRDDFAAQMREKGVGVGVYYPRALHTFPHIAKYGFKQGDFPVAEDAASQVVSLPIHPALTDDDIKLISDTIHEAANAR